MERNAEEKTAFQILKEALVSVKSLVHYNPKLPAELDHDLTSVGIGAIPSHVFPDGTEIPISIASELWLKQKRITNKSSEKLLVLSGESTRSLTAISTCKSSH